MQIGEENQSFAEINILLFDRLLDLDDQIRFAPDIACIADDFRSGVLVVCIGKSGLRAGLRFDEDFVASFGEFFNTRWRNADPGFVVLDLFGNADNHG